jgi:hypothetical protein
VANLPLLKGGLRNDEFQFAHHATNFFWIVKGKQEGRVSKPGGEPA